MLRRPRLLLPVVALVLGACNPPLEEVTTGVSGSSDTSTGTGTVAPGTTAATTTPAEETSGPSPSETAVDTTMGVVGTTTFETSETSETTVSSSSSSGPPPQCDEGQGCGSNEVCDDGVCVEACGGTWGEGSYGYCLNEYGDFDTDTICGPDHVCVFWNDRTEEISQVACALQGCTDACDCPPPPSTGDAVVTCGDITDPPEMNDCYLSCGSGETCPDGMSCNAGGVCVVGVPDLPVYGDCGNLASDCADPSYCIAVPSNETVCTLSCEDAAMDCPMAVPPGGSATVACTDVVPSEPGFECYLSCAGDLLSCPDGMTCINGTLCMWPD